nr:truncated cyclin B1 [synthetic construct]
MALRVTRNSKINAENKAKINMAGAKRVPTAPAATSKPGLRPRTALGDIGNKVSEQLQAKMPMKKEAKPSATGKVIDKKLPKPLEKVPMLVPVPVSEPVPEPEPEPEPEPRSYHALQPGARLHLKKKKNYKVGLKEVESSFRVGKSAITKVQLGLSRGSMRAPRKGVFSFVLNFSYINYTVPISFPLLNNI